MRSIRFILLLLIWSSLSITAQVRLPKLISDGMVLQRDKELTLWGWASPNEKVEIDFKNHQYKTITDSDGKWQIQLPSQSPGGPFKMKISASNQILINDILIGDVWLCSGQSNMELPISRVEPKYRKEIKRINNTGIRQFRVPYNWDFNQKQADLKGGKWLAATPENIMSFSAVAYFFAQKVQQTQQVPIGIINASMGGSPVEAWLSEDDLKPFKDAYKELQKFKDSTVINAIEASDKQRSDTWFSQLAQNDKGRKNADWTTTDLNDNDWQTAIVPGYWKQDDLENLNGIVWYRRSFSLSEKSANQPAELDMGRIVDADSVFINGSFIGNTTYQYPPRRYKVPENTLKSGKNTIAVKVISQIGTGGFVPDKPYELRTGSESINLSGTWKYKIGASMAPLEGPTFIRWKPAGLYNGMIAPLTNLSIKGAVWYQGESNVDNASQYKERLSAMIQNWRREFNEGELPFVIIQLANYLEPDSLPKESDWAVLRDAQFKVAQKTEHCQSVNIIDLGEWNDIHPLNKKEVGRRTALAAEKVAYGKKVVCSGPVFDSYSINNSKVELSFKYVYNGLRIKEGNSLNGFAIAGKDGQFIWAHAEIKGNKVMVWHESVDKPTAIRYAWANNPDQANLYNTEGLPAVPFRLEIRKAK
ncbi:sialate O-acetylesterase [Carboxylicivirga linearis]|uniref:Beta galactosidase jelly roll domain-containing protein n=1 Tax=Carboxylicivirga linearis TaxID=1628157 RepID=A0ABS5JXR1_9BACT|nr:sialate O-acetylesterase [Carboxylicivirga linearis]MBS2099702.1 beta galactosidase jelly roll domain-containing protein [Carboxylicivirga linearis]